MSLVVFPYYINEQKACVHFTLMIPLQINTAYRHLLQLPLINFSLTVSFFTASLKYLPQTYTCIYIILRYRLVMYIELQSPQISSCQPTQLPPWVSSLTKGRKLLFIQKFRTEICHRQTCVYVINSLFTRDTMEKQLGAFHACHNPFTIPFIKYAARTRLPGISHLSSHCTQIILRSITIYYWSFQ